MTVPKFLFTLALVLLVLGLVFIGNNTPGPVPPIATTDTHPTTTKLGDHNRELTPAQEETTQPGIERL